jgi:hypothetical protein
MNKKSIILKLLIIFCINSLFAQKFDTKNYNIMPLSCQDDGIYEKFHVCIIAKEKHLNKKVWYAWYFNNRIHYSFNNHSGRLLHGLYSAYYPNDNLKSKGNYFYGTKDGIWYTWDMLGNIISISTWNKGLESGSFVLFYTNKNIHKKLNYKQGELHKTQYIYSEKADSIINSKRGLKHGKEKIIMNDTTFIIKYRNNRVLTKDTIVNGISIKKSKKHLKNKNKLDSIILTNEDSSKKQNKKEIMSSEEKKGKNRKGFFHFFKSIKIKQNKKDEES